MNRREIFAQCMSFQTPEHVIIDLEGCPLSGMTPECANHLYEFLGYNGTEAEKKERLLQFLDIDTRGVGHILHPKGPLYKYISNTEYIDEWGMHRKYTGLYWNIVNAPLRNATLETLETYPWPSVDLITDQEIDDIVLQAKTLHEQTDYIVCASHPVYGVFELGCWMCGFDDFCMRMAIDEPFVHRFFEIILKYQQEAIERYYTKLAPYIDFTSSGDDFATQTSLFVSPTMFEEMIAPYFSERIRLTKAVAPVPYLHHSCGNVSRLIPQLIECGVDILNPIQPTGPDMQPELLKKAHYGQIVFHGGLDTQSVLPYGTVEQVEQSVNELIDVMQPGGGYIFAAAHNLQADVPAENIVAMFEAARRWKGKR